MNINLSLPVKKGIKIKELSSWHKLLFLNLYTFATRFCYRPLIFQIMNSVRSNSLNMKYQRLTLSECEDIGIRKFKFVAITQFMNYSA